MGRTIDRSGGSRGRARCWLVAALALVLAAPAWAAKVVDLRVGRHDAFTRVVFELDGFAGYKIERNAPAPGIAELVVSLNAESEERRLSIAKALVESVDLQPEGARSVARIRLTGDGVAMNIKQMTLANPPRIVLDVLGRSEAAPAAKPVAKKQEPTPAAKPQEPAPSTSRERDLDDIASSIEVDDDDELAAEEDGADEEAAGSGAQPVAKPAAVARPKPPSAPATPLPSPAARKASPPVARAAKPVARPAAAPAPVARPATQARPTPKPPAAKPAARPARPPASLPPVPAEEASGLDLMTMALGGVGLLVVGAGGFLLLRRRRGAAVAEALDGFESDNPFAVEETADAPIPEAAESGGADDLFGGPSEGAEPIAQERFDVAPDDQPVSRDPAAASAAKTPAGATGDLFDTPAAPAATGDASMDTQSADFSATQFNPRAAGAAMPAAGGDDATTTLVRELERRLSALESRFDEVVDAKERLERQVAAQTEELRVQRAAIARTQRAVRSMGRGGEDDAATEPALRDPNKPGAGRE